MINANLVDLSTIRPQGGKKMKKYEVMYIIRPSVEGEAVKKIVTDFSNLFTNFKSTVVELKELGLKDLAYEIDHHQKGYYVWMLVEANNDAINEFNRVVRINESILRFIVVKEGEKSNEQSFTSRSDYKRPRTKSDNLRPRKR
jgi:small subunit ribosomal protein S6